MLAHVTLCRSSSHSAHCEVTGTVPCSGLTPVSPPPGETLTGERLRYPRSTVNRTEAQLLNRLPKVARQSGGAQTQSQAFQRGERWRCPQDGPGRDPTGAYGPMSQDGGAGPQSGYPGAQWQV